jgi:hypothetical protein
MKPSFHEPQEIITKEKNKGGETFLALVEGVEK